jgi:hypothetical protein
MTFLASVKALPRPESRKFPVFGRKWDQSRRGRRRDWLTWRESWSHLRPNTGNSPETSSQLTIWPAGRGDEVGFNFIVARCLQEPIWGAELENTTIDCSGLAARITVNSPNRLKGLTS